MYYQQKWELDHSIFLLDQEFGHWMELYAEGFGYITITWVGDRWVATSVVH